MKKSTLLRFFGVIILIFNIWVIGAYNIEGVATLFLTFGFAIGFEYLIVRPTIKT